VNTMNCVSLTKKNEIGGITAGQCHEGSWSLDKPTCTTGGQLWSSNKKTTCQILSNPNWNLSSSTHLNYSQAHVHDISWYVPRPMYLAPLPSCCASIRLYGFSEALGSSWNGSHRTSKSKLSLHLVQGRFMLGIRYTVLVVYIPSGKLT
jgi:hypothetical protein